MKSNIQFVWKAAKQVGLGLHRFIRGFEPWGVLIAIVGLFVTMLGFMIELEDRQSERIFRAWEVVLQATREASEIEQIDVRDTDHLYRKYSTTSGSSVRQALEYLNRDFSGRWCLEGIKNVSIYFTGNMGRTCVFPRKRRENFDNITLRFINLSQAALRHASFGRADLRGADLTGADLQLANLQVADMRGADLSCVDANPNEKYCTSLRGANLVNADLSCFGPYATQLCAKLYNVEFGCIDLRNGESRCTNLQYADLRGAYLVEVNLDGVDLANARLEGIHGLKCDELRRAKNWQQTFRDERLNCDEP